jgi:DNA-binding NarL/FixJ family response regulator
MLTSPSPALMRLLLVGAQQLLRESLAFLLAFTNEIQIIGQIDIDLTHLLFIKASPPDVVLVDVDLPNGPNLNLIPELRQQFPALPFVVLTSCTQSGPLRQLLALNIQACLTKDIAYQELVDALFSVTKSGGQQLLHRRLPNCFCVTKLRKMLLFGCKSR